MGHEKALAFVSISVIAVVFVLKTAHVLHTSYPVSQRERSQEAVRIPEITETKTTGLQVVDKTNSVKVAICILTRRDSWERRHLVRQTWLQDVPDGVQMSHIFVMGEDESFTEAENARLAEEVEAHQDILIAPADESTTFLSEKTKYCIYWVTKNHDFDVLIKTNDDSMLILSRIVGPGSWLGGIRRDDFVYFGKKHPVTKVSNPDYFEIDEPVNTFTDFEFDYRGLYWPEYMEGGMYGFSRRLAEEIVKNNFRTYTIEDAMVGVWVSGLNADTLYLADEQVLHQTADYRTKNGSQIVVSFETEDFRLASMWCEYGPLGTLSQYAMLAEDVRWALDCLGSYQRFAHTPKSQPLGAQKSYMENILSALGDSCSASTSPDYNQTGKWWSRMGGAFRGRSAVVIGKSPTVDRLPLYLLRGLHSLVFDDFFRVAERYTRTKWAPTMYMCVDPQLCASDGDKAQDTLGTGGVEVSKAAVANVESANRFARTVFAAFYIMNNVDGVEYWRFLRQRASSHWYFAGAEGKKEDKGAVETGFLVGMDESSGNFGTLSRHSGVAMGIEILSYLGFSPIYITGAHEEIDAEWDEITLALQLAGSSHGAEIIYLYADNDDTLSQSKVGPSRGKNRQLNSQQEFEKHAEKISGAHAGKSANWDLQMLLENFPLISRLEIVRDASSVRDMFPSSPHCRDAEDLDRFQKAVLCPIKISLKHYSSFLAWHVPYGPVRGLFIWAKR